MAATLLGRIDWNLQRDKEGHRDYKIRFLIKTDDPDDGPEVVMNTPGLPVTGAGWVFGNDSDLFALAWPTLRVTPVVIREKNIFWIAENLFTTKPLSRCQDTDIEDPLSEPDRQSGSFVKYTKEATEDRFGNPIKNTAHERVRGPIVEFDHNRPTIKIGTNKLTLPLTNFANLVDSVNDDVAFGLAARQVKLSNVSWTRLLFGVCSFYYSIDYEFDVDFNTFDRTHDNEGSKSLQGHAPGSSINPALDPDGVDPDIDPKTFKENPKRFEIYKDENGENTRVFLDSKGRPIDDIANVFKTDIDFYPEEDFTTLGISLVL